MLVALSAACFSWLSARASTTQIVHLPLLFSRPFQALRVAALKEVRRLHQDVFHPVGQSIHLALEVVKLLAGILALRLVWLPGKRPEERLPQARRRIPLGARCAS
jgi:hypothetical protein